MSGLGWIWNLSQEHWVWGRNTPWMGSQSIARHHSHTYSQLGTIYLSQSTNWHVSEVPTGMFQVFPIISVWSFMKFPLFTRSWCWSRLTPQFHSFSYCIFLVGVAVAVGSLFHLLHLAYCFHSKWCTIPSQLWDLISNSFCLFSERVSISLELTVHICNLNKMSNFSHLVQFFLKTPQNKWHLTRCISSEFFGLWI